MQEAPPPLDLQDRHALVCGDSAGIGRAAAVALAAAGARARATAAAASGGSGIGDYAGPR